MYTALTIAGSDCSGGAGIQADLKTMTMNGVYAMSVLTALTAQNTTGVRSIMEVTPEFLKEQLDAVFEDIRPDAVKIGMVSSGVLIDAIAERLIFHKVENIVVDPVMVATSGSKLIADEALSILKEKLLPLATVVTPNIPEAEILSGRKIENEADMLEAAKVIGEAYHCAVLCKGGHSINDANDLLYYNGKYQRFYGKRIDNPNTHGTGCTLSSAIASNLAKGYRLEDAVEKAKEYISQMKKYQTNPAQLTRSEKEGMLYTRQKIDAAQMFIESVKQRRRTLYDTMKAIIDLQRTYLLTKDEEDKVRLVLEDVARHTGYDISTISRVCNSKCVLLDGRIYPLSSFFKLTRKNAEGEEIDGHQVKDMLNEIVNSEDKSNPLTDEKIVEIMKKRGVNLARRTVAKYRVEMGIPSVKNRRG